MIKNRQKAGLEAAIICTVVWTARAATILPLGGLQDVPNPGMVARGATAPGSVVGTFRQGAFWKAFHWDARRGMQPLPGIGSEYSHAEACNSAGRVVGHGFIPNTRRPALIWEPAGERWTVVELPQPDGSPIVQSAYPRAINAGGIIVGSATDFPGHQGVERPIVWLGDADGSWRFAGLETLGGKGGQALAVNDAGLVAGWSQTRNGTARPCLWQPKDGRYELPLELPDPEGASGPGEALAINALGQVVGQAGERACLWSPQGGSWKGALLPSLPGTSRSRASAINAQGLIAGQMTSAEGVSRAFVGTLESVTDLNRVVDPDASWALHSAEALTEDGALVGQGDHQGVSTAYRLQIDAIESASLLRGERIGRPEPWTLDYSAKEDRLSGSFRTEALAPGKHVARSRIVLSGPDGKQYAEEESTAVTAQFNYTFPEDAPGGTYPVEWQGYNAEGAQEAVFGTVFYRPGPPVWRGWSSRYENLVLPPFTPLTVDRRSAVTRIGCWGREMVYDQHPFPTRIGTRLAENLLSGPIRLEAEGLSSIAGSPTPSSSSPTRMEAQSSFDDATCTFTNAVWAEYDGVLFHEVSLQARQPLRNLRLVIPIQRRWARFLHWTVAGYGEGNGATMDLDKDVALPFKPVVWIGDYEQGLCWFAEHRNEWGKTASGRPIQVVLDEETCRLEILLGDRVEPGEKIRIDFGLLATPVKPLPENYPFDIFGDFSSERHLGRPELLRELEGTGVKVFTPKPYDCFGAGFWDSRLDHTGEQRLDEKLAEAVQTYREERGYEIMPYFGPCVLPEDYPESEAYRQDWERLPTRHFRYQRQRNGQTVPFLNCWFCPNSEARDFFAWGIADLLRRSPKIGGLYFDFGPARACSNKRHGCQPDSYAILGMRRFYRALAAELHMAGKRDYAIALHNSDSMQIPALTFVTHLFNGERFRAQSSPTIREGRDYLDGGVKPAVYSVEMSSMPWGITSSMYTPTDPLPPEYQREAPAEDFTNRLYRLSRSAMAGTLVHGSIPAIWRFHPDYAKRILLALASFDVRQAEFLPFWRNAEYLGDLPADVRVSIYRKDSGDCLLVVANLDAEEREIAFDLKTSTLGIPSNAVCAELMGPRDARLIRSDAKRVALVLQGHSLALVRIAPPGTFEAPRFDPDVERPVRRPIPTVQEEAKAPPSTSSDPAIQAEWTGPERMPALLDGTRFLREIPRLSAAPTLDGQVDAAEWEGAFSFPLPIEGSPANASTDGDSRTVYLGYDQKNLYVALRSGLAPDAKRPPRAARAGLVPPRLVLDAPESVVLWIGRPGSDPWGFAGSPSGEFTAWQGRKAGRVEGWSRRDAVETTIFDTEVWHAEFAIPLKTLGIEQADGAELAFAIVHRRLQASGSSSQTAWPRADKDQATSALGRLRLSPTAPIAKESSAQPSGTSK